MVKSAIYQIVNVLTGFRYIGSTENFSKRKRAHLYRLRKHIHENLHLQRAWDKYGEEAFRIFVIEYIDLEKLLTREQEYLDLLFASGQYYNKSKLAIAPAKGLHHSNETKKQLAEAAIGKKHTPETKEKIRQALLGNKNCLGRKASPETLVKMSNGQKKRKREAWG